MTAAYGLDRNEVFDVDWGLVNFEFAVESNF
jgi:hypothetical protein